MNRPENWTVKLASWPKETPRNWQALNDSPVGTFPDGELLQDRHCGTDSEHESEEQEQRSTISPWRAASRKIRGCECDEGGRTEVKSVAKAVLGQRRTVEIRNEDPPGQTTTDDWRGADQIPRCLDNAQDDDGDKSEGDD